MDGRHGDERERFAREHVGSAPRSPRDYDEWRARAQRDATYPRRAQRAEGTERGYAGSPRGEMPQERSDFQPPRPFDASEHGPTADRADYTGRGPRGYVRSDARLLEVASELLEDAPDVDATEIALRVESGVVTLEGYVPTRAMKRRAEELIEVARGVRDVVNLVRVAVPHAPGSHDPNSDVRRSASPSSSRPSHRAESAS